MIRNMFRTLEIPRKSKFNPTRILLTLSAICIVIILLMYAVALFPQSYRIKDRILEATFPMNLTAIGLLILAALYYILFSKKSGKLTGSMELRNDGITINGQEFKTDEIEKIRIIGNDIAGEFRGFVSKGTQNHIILHTKNGAEISTAFEQTKSNRLQDQREVLQSWYDQGILAEANYHNIINNTNYY